MRATRKTEAQTMNGRVFRVGSADGRSAITGRFVTKNPSDPRATNGSERSQPDRSERR